ncbi:MAG: hypothetical protein WC480_00430 [Patescibacteria group bacterium]
MFSRYAWIEDVLEENSDVVWAVKAIALILLVLGLSFWVYVEKSGARCLQQANGQLDHRVNVLENLLATMYEEEPELAARVMGRLSQEDLEIVAPVIVGQIIANYKEGLLSLEEVGAQFQDLSEIVGEDLITQWFRDEQSQ